ncbi:NAD-dependent epimerase/dehydratase family protein [Halovivax gelatinilyticus]|uniref:NAD-dependent epimerase/dehydratase family protein n=1 Tax=Halovivax gelatinilyticus TaxID=2961597 RepID=UPI0020CA77E9|nr:NAD-dependent epimerase/dehydratase family protein [Halovivax gelatinilyticus]
MRTRNEEPDAESVDTVGTAPTVTPPPELRERAVLVTGGAGFIGSKIAAALSPVADVTVYDSFESGDREAVPDGASVVRADVRDEEALESAVAAADVVFHEAAVVSVERSIETPRESHAVNAQATLALLDAARRHDTRVVIASSAAIYGQPASVPIAEPDPKRPTSPYGLEKLAADRYATLYHDLYGVETVALRYFNVYGPGQSGGDYAGVIRVFVEQALSGGPITVHGEGDQTRDFVAVDDVVRANLAAATTDRVGRAYNVATGRSISIAELAEIIREAAGSDADIVYTDPRAGDIERSEADVSRAVEELGFEATVPIEEGIRETVEWYRRQSAGE